MRTWNDATGKFSVKAKMLSKKNGKVELEKEDGKIISLPATKLSDKDQAYLKEVERAAAAESDPDNPFAGGTKKTARDSGRSSGSASVDAPVTIPELTNAIVLSESEWSFEPDPAVSATPYNKVTKFKTNLTEHEFHNKIVPKLSTNKKFIAASISNPFEDDRSEIVTIDLESGKSSKPASFKLEDAKLFAISDDAQTAVTFREGRGSRTGRLDFWRLSEGTATHKAHWQTAKFGDRDGFEPKSGTFVGPSMLLTFGRNVAMWDCETAAALYSFPLPRNSAYTLSPGGNQLALVSGQSIYFVDVKDGKMIGSLEAEQSVDFLAMSQNGQFLAGLARSGEIRIWDLTSQEVVRQLSVTEGVGTSIQWCGDKYLLVNRSDLMDVELRAMVWEYTSSGGSILNGHDGRFWYVGKSKVTPIKLPHKNLDAKTAKYDPDELLLLKPGAEVSIKLDTTFAPSEEREIREKLTSTLKAKEASVRQGAALELVGTVKKLKQETVDVSDFGGFGRRRNAEKITFTPHVATLSLVQDGKKIWNRVRNYSPGGLIRRNRNESTQQAASRLSRPQTNFFTAFKFPKYFAVLPVDEPPGKSKISEQGVQ